MEEEQKKVSGAAVLPKVGWKGMLALAFGILFFAGVFATVQGAEWLKEEDLFSRCHSFLPLCWPLVL